MSTVHIKFEVRLHILLAEYHITTSDYISFSCHPQTIHTLKSTGPDSPFFHTSQADCVCCLRPRTFTATYRSLSRQQQTFLGFLALRSNDEYSGSMVECKPESNSPQSASHRPTNISVKLWRMDRTSPFEKSTSLSLQYTAFEKQAHPTHETTRPGKNNCSLILT